MTVKNFSLKQAMDILEINLHCQMKAIKGDIRQGVIPLIIGPPGIGKTQILEHDMLRRMEKITGNEWGCVCKYLSTFPLEKMTGLPKNIQVSETDFAKWTIPNLLDLSDGKTTNPKSSNILLVFDDFHTINNSIKVYLYDFLITRKIQNFKLPDNVVLVAAGNRAEDDMMYQELPRPVVNRLAQYFVEPQFDSWMKYAVNANIRMEIISFLQHDESYFYTDSVNDMPFATPRSWENLSHTIDTAYEVKGKIHPDFIYQLATGIIGCKNAAEFDKYLQLIYKWNPANILLNKQILDFDKMTPIDCYSLLAACSGEMTSMFRKRTSPEYKDRVKPYIENMKKLLINCHKTCAPIVPACLAYLCQYEATKFNSNDLSYEIIPNEMVADIRELIEDF